MNTVELDTHLGSHPKTRKIFAGVFAADTLPKGEKKYDGSVYIVNMDKAKDSGSHWVAITLDLPHSEYFDSYGLAPLQEFEQFIGNDYVLNTTMLQSATSTVCGQYCMLYACHRAAGENLGQFIGKLTNNTDVNDCIVNSAANKLFETNKPIIDSTLLYGGIYKQCCRAMIEYV